VAIDVVAPMTARMLAPKALADNAEYVACVINYSLDGIAALEALVRWPPALRWLVFRSGWLPESRPLQRHRATMSRLIAPYVRAGAGSSRSGSGGSSDDEQCRNLLFWTLQRTAAATTTDRAAAAAATADVAQQAQHQLLASLAAMHTTGMTLAHALFDLASRPEYVAPLRREAEEALAAPPGTAAAAVGGLTTLAQVARLRKLDSFLKESQRANPLLPLTFRRIVLADTVVYDDDAADKSNEITINSNGNGNTGGGGGGNNTDGDDKNKLKRKPVTVLPRGLYIAAANSAIARDPRLLDGNRGFDGFRYERLAHQQQQPQQQQQQQQQQQKQRGEKPQGLPLTGQPSRLVDTGAGAMSWSHGRHACPGRYFAAVELKLVLVHLLLHYDIRMPVGADGRPLPRPANVEKDSNWLPDPAGLLMLRRRKTCSTGAH
jgi:hypothetical protein